MGSTRCLLYLESVLVCTRHEADRPIWMRQACVAREYVRNNDGMEMANVWCYTETWLTILVDASVVNAARVAAAEHTLA